MVNFMAAMWFRIGLIAAAFSLSTLPAQACSCAGGNPGSCEVPVGDIIVRATMCMWEGPAGPTILGHIRKGEIHPWSLFGAAQGPFIRHCQHTTCAFLTA